MRSLIRVLRSARSCAVHVPIDGNARAETARGVYSRDESEVSMKSRNTRKRALRSSVALTLSNYRSAKLQSSVSVLESVSRTAIIDPSDTISAVFGGITSTIRSRICAAPTSTPFPPQEVFFCSAAFRSKNCSPLPDALLAGLCQAGSRQARETSGRQANRRTSPRPIHFAARSSLLSFFLPPFLPSMGIFRQFIKSSPT